MAHPRSPSLPVSLVNFSGNWLQDVSASDSLDALLAYHGLAKQQAEQSQQQSSSHVNHVAHSSSIISTTASSSGQVTQSSRTEVAPSLRADALLSAAPVGSLTDPSSSALSSVSEAGEEDARSDSGGLSPPSPPAASVDVSVPALIVQHSVRRFTSYLHALIPRFNAAGHLQRYDPAVSNTKLPIHESFVLDAEWHTVATARGRVPARAYFAPHGQSLVVDQRCASKYDLERTERFLEDGGKRMVVEIRILSCAPDAQDKPVSRGHSSKFAEDAPATPAPTSSVQVKELLFLKRVYTRIIDAKPPSSPAIPAPASSPLSPSPTAAAADDDASAREARSAGAGAAAGVASVRTQLPPAALAILPSGVAAAALGGGSESAVSAASADAPSLSTALYPRTFLLRRYQLSDLLPARTLGSVSTATPMNLASAQAKEQSAFARARAHMTLIDLLLALLLATLLFAHTFGSDPAHARAAAQEIMQGHGTAGWLLTYAHAAAEWSGDIIRSLMAHAVPPATVA